MRCRHVGRAAAAGVPRGGAQVARAFHPEILITQHGAYSRREDPLADLDLSVDAQRTSSQAPRDLAKLVTGSRWLALGGGGTHQCVWRAGCGRTCWRSSPAITSGHALAVDWLAQVSARPETSLPVDMSGGAPHPVPFERRVGTLDLPVDRSIHETLHGLDAHDPRGWGPRVGRRHAAHA